MEQVSAAVLFEHLGRLYVSVEVLRAEVERLRSQVELARLKAANGHVEEVVPSPTT